MTRKLDKEHLDAIQELQDQFTQNTLILGNVALEQESIKYRLDELDTQKQKCMDTFKQLKQRENNLVEQMRERYGDGEINVADGTFTSEGQ
jgi:hypothetical protein